MSKAPIDFIRFAWLMMVSVTAGVWSFGGCPATVLSQEKALESVAPPIPESYGEGKTSELGSVPVPTKSKTEPNHDSAAYAPPNTNASQLRQKLVGRIRPLPSIDPEPNPVAPQALPSENAISHAADANEREPKSNDAKNIRPLPAITDESLESKTNDIEQPAESSLSMIPSEASGTSDPNTLTSPAEINISSHAESKWVESTPTSKTAADTESTESDLGSFRIELAQDFEEPLDANSMWWHTKVIIPLDERDTELINPDTLLHHALQNSPFILAISKSPLIRQTNVGEACAEFDPEIFLLSQFDDRYDPVGNQLTTGTTAPFLKDHIWSGDLGVRRKMMNGATLEARQQFGFQNSNSSFFDPQDQGTATLSLNYAQPLLRGRGSAYNRHQILIAQLDSTASWDVFAAQLQDELTKIVEAYWSLYFHRARLLQKENNVKRGEEVLRKLEDRSALDSLPSQIARARSAVQLRRTELANARRDIKNAETNIRRLIGSPENFQAMAPELLPEEAPSLIEPQRDLTSVIEQAIQLRPEIKQAIQRGKVAAVQKRVSEHELLPELNLIFNTYVAALKGDSDILGAWGDQFTGSSPGYGVGFEFNTPYYRRAARSINKRQGLVLDQVRHEIDQTVNNVVAEAQIAWRQVDSAYQTVISAAAAISAARTDLLQNEARWNSFALIEGDLSEGQNPTTLLDQLLDAQQRLANAELTYSESLLEFKRAEVELKRATGQLLNHGPFTPPTEVVRDAIPNSHSASPRLETLPTPESR